MPALLRHGLKRVFTTRILERGHGTKRVLEGTDADNALPSVGRLGDEEDGRGIWQATLPDRT